MKGLQVKCGTDEEQEVPKKVKLTPRAPLVLIWDTAWWSPWSLPPLWRAG